jgi:hypothetical protein
MMKRAILLLSLVLSAACASNDGFVQKINDCAPGSPITLEAGWETPASSMERAIDDRLTLLVRVANNSDNDITVKSIHADPMAMDRETMYEIDRGARDFNDVIAEGEEKTFEIPMMSRRRMQTRTTGVRASGVDVAVTVSLEPEENVRCRFRLPLGF